MAPLISFRAFKSFREILGFCVFWFLSFFMVLFVFVGLAVTSKRSLCQSGSETKSCGPQAEAVPPPAGPLIMCP